MVSGNLLFRGGDYPEENYLFRTINPDTVRNLGAALPSVAIHPLAWVAIGITGDTGIIVFVFINTQIAMVIVVARFTSTEVGSTPTAEI